MNFYIDFEATQFSERIISIGCVAENGARFDTFVKPVKNEKVNTYITQLTGITNDMLENAPTANEAFNAFYEFVKYNNGEDVPAYYCYGYNDKRFIERTIFGMSDFQAITFASSIKDLLIDFSKTATAHLGVSSISLKNLTTLVRHEDIIQKHDALEDAIMLKECYEKLDSLEKVNIEHKNTKPKTIKTHDAYLKIVEEYGELPAINLPGHVFSQAEANYLKQLRSGWHGIKPIDIMGDGTPDKWSVKMTHIFTGEVKYFTEPWVAAMFLNACVLKRRSCKDLASVNKTMKEMAKNPNNFGGYRCEIIKEEN